MASGVEMMLKSMGLDPNKLREDFELAKAHIDARIAAVEAGQKLLVESNDKMRIDTLALFRNLAHDITSIDQKLDEIILHMQVAAHDLPPEDAPNPALNPDTIREGEDGGRDGNSGASGSGS
jgi:two-component sensor histidine kinase